MRSRHLRPRRAVFAWLRSKSFGYWMLAGPGSLIVALFFLAGAPVWMPPGPGGVDHVYLPVVFFPAIWGAAFFYAVLSDHLWRVYGVFCIVSVVGLGFAASSGGW
ncbi:MAG: hypothetical protein AAGC95_00060 [Pseudomonadota bacterium]